MMTACVQPETFDAVAEYRALCDAHPGAAIVTFTGTVRDFSANTAVSALELEHYPGMAEASLAELGERVAQQFALLGWRIVHRYGRLMVGEPIVWAGVVADHRAEAFAACEMIMDVLKTDAPFWKREYSSNGAEWIGRAEQDIERRRRWDVGEID
jgi:molybdopterin synthase catalytic subunit